MTAPADDLPPDASTLLLELDERGRLKWSRPSGDDVVLNARRAFPWSKPSQWISLRSLDGAEVALLESLDAPLPTASAEAIRRALSIATFVPKIIRVERVDLQHGYQLWDVETEAGAARLRVQEREDIRFLSDTRFSVKDADGNVYEISDITTLDAHSRRELSRVI